MPADASSSFLRHVCRIEDCSLLAFSPIKCELHTYRTLWRLLPMCRRSVERLTPPAGGQEAGGHNLVENNEYDVD
jgi:hypothetical protein